MPKIALYDHQKRIIKDDPKKAGLWLGTGSGKTRLALMLAKGSTLVICPKTQKQDGNWERELRAIGKTPITRLKVMSKEEFRKLSARVPKFDTLIIDEAHTCLGATPGVVWRKRLAYPKTSQIFEAVQAWVARCAPKRLYLCTATISKSPMTVWAAGQILGKDWNFYEFRMQHYVRLNMIGREAWKPKDDGKSQDELIAKIRSLGYVGQLSDYFDVPEQTYRTEHFDASASQSKRLRELKIEFPDPLVLIGKRHQVENGVLKGDMFNPSESFDCAKTDRIVDLAEEFPTMIVFAKYTEQIASISKALSKAKVRTFILDGSTKDKGAVLQQARSCDRYAFIAQCQVSAGWELPECPVMVFASNSYSVVDRIQAEGRILRANGLKKNLYIDLVMRGGVDQAVHACMSKKKDFDEKIYAKTLD